MPGSTDTGEVQSRGIGRRATEEKAQRQIQFAKEETKNIIQESSNTITAREMKGLGVTGGPSEELLFPNIVETTLRPDVVCSLVGRIL